MRVLLLIFMLPLLIPFGYSGHDSGLGDGKQQDLELIKENSIEKGMENRLKDSRLKNPFQKALEDGLESVEEKQEENE